MDQIYLPKQRSGLPVGSYVSIRLVLKDRIAFKPIFYGVKKIEPIKMEIVKKVFSLIEGIVECSNIIVTGSFIKQGFGFRDLDVLVVYSGEKVNEKEIAQKIKEQIGAKAHVIFLTDKELSIGAARDPLYLAMINRCIARNRFTYHLQKRIIHPQLLDVHLLKSKVVFYSFDFMSGNDLYYAVRNIVAISLFLKGRISAELIGKEIENIFSISEEDIRRKAFKKTSFLKKYQRFYNTTFKEILKHAHDAKSKQTS